MKLFSLEHHKWLMNILNHIEDMKILYAIAHPQQKARDSPSRFEVQNLSAGDSNQLTRKNNANKWTNNTFENGLHLLDLYGSLQDSGHPTRHESVVVHIIHT